MSLEQEKKSKKDGLPKAVICMIIARLSKRALRVSSRTEAQIAKYLDQASRLKRQG